jgi:cysteinyl-tRNA synthetase
MKTCNSPASLLSVAASLAGTLLAASLANAEPAVATQPQSDDAAIHRRQQMEPVRNWGYWLSSFEVRSVAAAPHDLLVVDSEMSADRTFERELTPAEVVRMKHRPDGSPRVLLAYLSIGEADRYRPYWQQDWYDPPRSRLARTADT